MALGLESVTIDEVVPSSFVAARWLVRNRPDVKQAYVIGSSGLCDELREAGVNVLTARDFATDGDDNHPADAAASLGSLASSVDAGPSVGAVVVGHDPAFNFKALCLASLYLEKGAAFISTNPDAYDMVGSHRMPGNGCLVAAVACVAGRGPDATCGKPAADLGQYLLEAYGLDASRTCMVGDRLDTDIALGHAMGSSSLLVLTGVVGADDLLEELRHQEGRGGDADDGTAPMPTHVISHLGKLFELADAPPRS